MVTAWMLNAVGLYATTVGALLIYLHLRRPIAVHLQGAEQTAYEQHQKRLRIGVGLLAAWLLIQDIAVLML